MNPSEYHTKLTANRENIFSPDSYLSKSVLWELENSTPRAWRHFRREFTPTDAMAFGSAVDCKLLTPDLFSEEFVLSPFESFRTKEAKEWKAEQLEARRTILTEGRLDEVSKAIEALSAHPIAGKMFAPGTGTSQAIETGSIRDVQFKCMLDWVGLDDDYLTDLKTIQKVDRRTIEKHSANFGYHVQAAIYRKIWSQAHPEDQREKFRFVWVESSYPYNVAVTEMPESSIQAGEAKAAELLTTLIDCTKSNAWPGPFNDEVAEIGVPDWV